MEEILTKPSFFPSEPHTGKLCYTVVLKHFGGYSQRTSVFSPKSDKSVQKYSENLFFLTCLKMGKSWGEFGFV